MKKEHGKQKIERDGKWREGMSIPHICHESHEYTRVNFF